MKIEECILQLRPKARADGRGLTWDVDLPLSAQCHDFQLALEAPMIEGMKPTLVVLAVFSVDIEAPTFKRRLHVVRPGEHSDGMGTWLRSFLANPKECFALYELPIPAEERDAVKKAPVKLDLPTGGADVLAGFAEASDDAES